MNLVSVMTHRYVVAMMTIPVQPAYPDPCALPYRVQHRLRRRYTDLLQRRASGLLSPEETNEFLVLRATLNALEAPMYAFTELPHDTHA